MPKMHSFLLVGLLLLSAVAIDAHWPGLRRMKRHIAEPTRVTVERDLPASLLRDILVQIARFNKGNRETLVGDDQSRYYGEILDEYRQKYGYPRVEGAQH
ncbi:hypothetical protein QR680_015089 [Steinernema hermaphroditum]|uniref:Uncharacterized protein n=1 Tax=Steinernema hermaphroditum TaxID=289476 RepID=A0AA39IB53_9BILA|nr:hypothetical protein QR680_015089 [Steinernema hermaphroditum]